MTKVSTRSLTMKDSLMKTAVTRDNNEAPWECAFYRSSPVKLFLCYVLGVLSLGLLFLLLFVWKRDWGLQLTHNLTRDIAKATRVLVKTDDGRSYVASLVTESYDDGDERSSKDGLHSTLGLGVMTKDGRLIYFYLQKIKYIWHYSREEFVILRGLKDGVECRQFHQELTKGLTDTQVDERFDFFGENTIIVKIKPIVVMIFQEALNPFYVFQVFSVVVWCMSEYFLYSVVIVFISLVSIGVSLYTTRTQLATLKKMVESHSLVTVCRNGKEIHIPEGNLVPGDVIIIPRDGCLLTCDAVLLTGNCVVNESMLTGESVPVTKTYLPYDQHSSEVFSPTDHLRHTLLCGTRVIQTRSKDNVIAVVINTGFSTTKGRLIHSILYPVPSQIKLYRDALYFILVLSCFAAAGFVYDAIILATIHEASTREIIFSSADVITIAVAPALPAALTIGMVYAQLRLKEADIYCINPPKINLCGMLDVICFDKTGTLTEDGLDFFGIHEVRENSLSALMISLKDAMNSAALSVLASCHTLTYIAGELVGDPFDLKMFLATGWSLEESVEKSGESGSVVNTRVITRQHELYQGHLEVLKLYPFMSSLQRMSVLARSGPSSAIMVCTKGAPETIASLCQPETVPSNFKETLEGHTKEGFRVIGLAVKELPEDMALSETETINRSNIESDLTFVGLLVMKNKLKPMTATVIHLLNVAEHRTIMVTGDNTLTAVHVARESGMLQQCTDVYRVEVGQPKEDQGPELLTYEHLTIKAEEVDNDDIMTPRFSRGYVTDGASFDVIRQHHPPTMEQLLESGVVFARMTPHQKMQLVALLQERDLVVGMCGDGANDCGALKTAHMGVALSEEEASVAAPFTSKVQDISCVPKLMREGRAALTTSFAAFKFMALYSMIQFTTVIILNTVKLYIGNVQFLFIDICLCMLLVLFFARSPAHPKLIAESPPSKLMSPSIISSFACHVALQAVTQVCAFLVCRSSDWYKSPGELYELSDYMIHSYENTAVFTLSCFQYLIYSLLFSNGTPYRNPIYRNIPYMICMASLLVACTVLLFWPFDWMLNFFELVPLPSDWFKGLLLLLAVVNGVLSYIVEFLIVPNKPLRRCLLRMTSCCRRRGVAHSQRLDEAGKGTRTDATEMDRLYMPDYPI